MLVTTFLGIFFEKSFNSQITIGSENKSLEVSYSKYTPIISKHSLYLSFC